MAFSITASVASGEAPLSVQFTANEVPAGTESLFWDFGDGQGSSELNPIHVYLMAGAYTVTLTSLHLTACFAKSSATAAITVSEPLTIPRLDKCYRYGLGGELQGYGPSEFSGDHWIQAAPLIGGVEALDTNERARQVVFDNRYGVFCEVGRYLGPNGSGLTEQWADDVEGGTDDEEISGYVEFGEVTAEEENFEIEAMEAYFHLRPASGTSYREAQQIDISACMDGHSTAGVETMSDTTEDIPDNGEVSFSRPASGNRGRFRVDWAASNIVLVSADQHWKVSDVKRPDRSQLSEMDYQAEFAAPTLWLSRGAALLLERVTGVTLSGTVVASTGPDARTDSAMDIASALTLGTVALVGGMIILWTKGTVAVTIGGVAVTLTAYPTVAGSWTLRYASSITRTGSLVITPTGTGGVFDPRVFASTVSSAAIADYYDSVVNHDGDNYLD